MKKQLKKQSKDSASLLIELSKRVNVRKYLKRETLKLQGKTIQVLRDSSILKADLSVHDFQIALIRKNLYKTAEVILKKNGLTVNDIAVEDLELGSTSLINGHAEILSKDSNKTYFYSINLGELVLYTTPEEIAEARMLVSSTQPVPDLLEYIHFLNLPPF